MEQKDGTRQRFTMRGLSAQDLQSPLKTTLCLFFFFQDKVFVTFLTRTANYTKVWTMLTFAVIFKGMLFINAWKL